MAGIGHLPPLLDLYELDILTERSEKCKVAIGRWAKVMSWPIAVHLQGVVSFENQEMNGNRPELYRSFFLLFFFCENFTKKIAR